MYSHHQLQNLKKEPSKQKKRLWKREFLNSIRTLDELIVFFGYDCLKNSPYQFLLSEEYKKQFQQIQKKFRFQVTRYYLSLADIYNPKCPILLQILPSEKELQDPLFKDTDPLREEQNSPISGLIHRYPDRVLWYVSHHCAVYCRFCFRKRKVSNPNSNFFSKTYNEILNYIRSNPSIKEVILSGGDPLSLPNQTLEKTIIHLKSIPHLYSIRIHTRMLTTFPYRITKELCQVLKNNYPVTVITHFNHPVELTETVYRKIKMLKTSGVTILNQTVLLKNINDSTEVIESLNLKLLCFGIMPYYLHLSDEVAGTHHFRTSLQKGLEIIKHLQGRNPGISIPRFMVDLPNGGGKIPLQNSYVIDYEEAKKEYKCFNYELNPKKVFFIKEKEDESL